jgi:hypothetical protein
MKFRGILQAANRWNSKPLSRNPNPPQGDDVTPSLGVFRIIADPLLTWKQRPNRLVRRKLIAGDTIARVRPRMIPI